MATPCHASIALHFGGFRVVSGEGSGGQAGAGSPRSIRAMAPQGVCKYFNTVPTTEAEVDSSGLVHEHSFIEVLHTELQPLSLEPGTDLCLGM